MLNHRFHSFSRPTTFFTIFTPCLIGPNGFFSAKQNQQNSFLRSLNLFINHYIGKKNLFTTLTFHILFVSLSQLNKNNQIIDF